MPKMTKAGRQPIFWITMVRMGLMMAPPMPLPANAMLMAVPRAFLNQLVIMMERGRATAPHENTPTRNALTYRCQAAWARE